MSKHTPGPWEVKRIAGELFELSDAQGPILRQRGGMQPTEADARLIAAAPDMLQCLKLAESTLRALMSRRDLGEIEFQTVVQDLEHIHVAIAKAEGK